MRLYLFGVLRVCRFDSTEPDGVGNQHPLTGNAARLLAYIALQPHAQTRSQIAGALFPNVGEEQARRLLTNILYRLKKEIGDDYLLAEREQIGLQPLWVDVRQFEQLLSAGRSEETLALYFADLLTSLDDEWLLGQRVRLRERFLLAVAW